MKKLTILMVAIGCTVLICSSAMAGPIVIKWGDATAKSYSYYPACMIFKDQVEKATNGRVVVEYYGDAVLGDQKTLTEACRMGAVQMIVIASTVSQNTIPTHRLYSLPMLFPNYNIMRAWWDSEHGRAVGGLWENYGLKFLGYGQGGWIAVQNRKREVRTPGDLKGVKIRTMQDPVLVETQNALGALGTPMSAVEVYSAVQQGVLDGVSTSPQFLSSMKIYEVAKYYTHVNLHAATAMVLMNLKFWNSLPSDIQQIVVMAMQIWEKNNDDYYINDSKETSDNNILSFMRDKGVKCYVPTPKERDEFVRLTKPVFEKYRKDIGAEVVDKVAKFVGYYK